MTHRGPFQPRPVCDSVKQVGLWLNVLLSRPARKGNGVTEQASAIRWKQPTGIN